MLWRIAARLLTSPLAFLVAGIIDVVVFVATEAGRRIAVRTGLR